MDLEIFERDSKQFVSADWGSLPEWPRVPSNHPVPKLTLKADELFLIADTLGNIADGLENEQTINLGLFCHDTRFLSRLELQIEECVTNGKAARQFSPILLSSNADKGFALSVLCSNPRLPGIEPETIGIQREIVLNGGLFEEIEITNYNTKAVSFSITLTFEADFADLFEIRGQQRKKRGKFLRQIPQGVDPKKFLMLSEFQQDSLILAYQGLDGLLMESRIQFYQNPPDCFKGYTAVWQLSLEPHATKKIGYRLQMMTNHKSTVAREIATTLGQAKAANLLEEQEWCQRVTKIRSDNETFNQVISRAEQDIYLLLQNFQEYKALSAGVPWFSTLFGRDALIAASQTLILDPTIAKDTLQLLAHYQGQVNDEWRDEEPGKILHELRLGEMARCGEIPHTPYYGTVDATPLWLMLYAEYYAWTNDHLTLDRLWSNALAAMDWIDAQCQKTGYLSYERKSKSTRGLVNQGWKDSGDCIVDRHGKLATGAIALCEVQAYVYAAKIRLAHMARIKHHIDLATRWEKEATELKLRFNRDFWLEDEDFCALALDGEGKPVDSITSNPGHCLSLGIFTPEKAASVAERLLAPDLFSGWGIRTLSSNSPAYNPMGYHVGSVWPHDNAIIAAGLRALGSIDSALEVVKGTIDMTLQQPYQRPPELFCGHDRIDGSHPIQYPVACSPQAWATGSIFQLLTLMLNLVPDAPGNCLRIVDPTLPDFINKLSIQNLRIGSTIVDLDFERTDMTTACRVVKKRGNLRAIVET
ncbi:amylo-alpha-1,6-glucosidase [Hydrococcus rivularis NIES-593]|uniref:Amylo-alpha-1,6-glucosidase n=1 Tax=Hydrococcus rivularis NIES-593 TaxID=1921803 RepID=A0A1U7H7N6_9CYAN|nr:amylo-alpha-1,6-glucosidase [Hydrococcus rivularis]OKH18523.1 amylo-alpha-1,6-glucosidase [Hydrococcus rivularis NIES-593]